MSSNSEFCCNFQSKLRLVLNRKPYNSLNVDKVENFINVVTSKEVRPLFVNKPHVFGANEKISLNLFVFSFAFQLHERNQLTCDGES